MPIFSIDMQDSLVESTQLDVHAKKRTFAMKWFKNCTPETFTIIEENPLTPREPPNPGVQLGPNGKLIMDAMDAVSKTALVPKEEMMLSSGSERGCSDAVLPLALKYFSC